MPQTGHLLIEDGAPIVRAMSNNYLEPVCVEHLDPSSHLPVVLPSIFSSLA